MSVIEDELIHVSQPACRCRSGSNGYSRGIPRSTSRSAGPMARSGSGAIGSTIAGCRRRVASHDRGRRRLRELQRRRRRPVPDAQPPDRPGRAAAAGPGRHVPGARTTGSSASSWPSCSWPAPWPWPARWAAATCWPARRSRPVDRMAAAADEITASQLDRRLHAPNPNDELGRLARTLNGMIARLERLVRGGPPVHRRRRPRAAHPAGHPPQRGRGRAPRPPRFGTVSRRAWKTCSRRSSTSPG